MLGASRIWRFLDARSRILTDFLEQSASIRLLTIFGAIVGFTIVIGTAWQIWNDLIDRREERIERAWTRLLAQAGGNIGKGGAIQILWDEGISFDRVDLSCKSLGSFDRQLCT